MKTEAKRNCCKARTKSGKRCRAAAMPGGLCFFHANPNKASELGRIGGRNNRHVAIDAINPLPALKSARAVREAVDRLIVDVLSGRVDPKVAASVTGLLSLQLRAIDTTDIERRLVKLRDAEKKDAGGVSHDGAIDQPASNGVDAETEDEEDEPTE